LHLNSSGVKGQLFVGAPRPFWCSPRPCHAIVGAGAWCVSCSLLGIAKPVPDETRSYGTGHCVAPTVLWSGRRSWLPRLLPLWSLLIRNGVGFQPLHKVVHSYQEVSVSLVTSWEGPCYINGYPFEWGPNVVLMHLPQFLVRGPQLAAQVSHWQHHFSTSFLAWSQ
jgi:hypothetical protein